MTQASRDKEILLVGLGGIGIKSAIALRGEVKANLKARLFAYDISNFYGEYFREEPKEGPSEKFYLNSDEQFLLNQHVFSLEEAWAKVNKAAQLNDPLALKLSQKKSIRIGMEALFPTDIQALIFVSSDALESNLRDVLCEIRDRSENSSQPISVIICTSLFGHTGSQIYIPFIRSISKLAKEVGIESVTSFLIDTESASDTYWIDRRHTNRSNLALWEIYQAMLKDGEIDLIPDQYLISQESDELTNSKVLSEREFRQELARRVSIILTTPEVPFSQSLKTEILPDSLDGLNNSKIKITRLSEELFSQAREYLRLLPKHEQVWLKENY